MKNKQEKNMNKYVLKYSTGEYDDYMLHVKPLIYNGTKKQLKNEFLLCQKNSILKFKIANTLNKLNMLDKYDMWIWKSGDFKVGSKEFDINDFIEGYSLCLPTIYTVDEWYENE